MGIQDLLQPSYLVPGFLGLLCQYWECFIETQLNLYKDLLVSFIVAMWCHNHVSDQKFGVFSNSDVVIVFGDVQI